jgi:uncharacterized membrane protein
MIYLMLGLVLFLGVHSIAIIAPAWRDRTAARLGNAWRGLYSGDAIRSTGLDSLHHGRSHASCVYIVFGRVSSGSP